MRALSVLLILSLSTSCAYIPFSSNRAPTGAGDATSEPLPTAEEVRATECALKAVPADLESALIFDSLFRTEFAKVKSEQRWASRAVLWAFGKRIRKRVQAACIRPELCTPENVMAAVDLETRRAFGTMYSLGGYVVLAGMEAMIFGITVAVNKLSGGSLPLTIITNQLLGKYANLLQGPLDFKTDPPVRQFAARMVSNRMGTSKSVDARSVAKAQSMKEAYSDAERDGIYQGLINPQLSLSVKLQAFQGWFPTGRSAAELSAEEQDSAARMVATMLFEMRYFHAHVLPEDAEMLLLFRPYVRPVGAYALDPVISGKVWGVLHEYETELARLRGKQEYDRAEAQKYYDRLIDQWFKAPLPAIESRNSLTD